MDLQSFQQLINFAKNEVKKPKFQKLFFQTYFRLFLREGHLSKSYFPRVSTLPFWYCNFSTLLPQTFLICFRSWNSDVFYTSAVSHEINGKENKRMWFMCEFHPRYFLYWSAFWSDKTRFWPLKKKRENAIKDSINSFHPSVYLKTALLASISRASRPEPPTLWTG